VSSEGHCDETKTLPRDAAEHLETPEDMTAYLETVLEESDPALVATTLGAIQSLLPF
jgi:DNA-binding phage protein